MCRVVRNVAVTVVALAAGASPVRAQVRVGSEFQVHTHFNDRQVLASMAMGANGRFVVVWQAQLHPQDPSSYGVFGQLFEANGNRKGAEFRVNTYTTDRQTFPDVAMDADGDFVVVWESFWQDGPFDLSVFGQRYDAQGAPQGGEFRLHTQSVGEQRRPQVAMDAAGNFVAVWAAQGPIAGRLFDAAGNPIGTEFSANTDTAFFHNLASVSANASGGFVVVWESNGQDGDNGGAFGQLFDAAGAKVGAEFRANTYTTSRQAFPSVALGPSGRFAVVWTGYSGQDGSSGGVFGRAFDGAGNPRGGEFQVNTFTTSDQGLSDGSTAAAADGDGGFVVTWSGDGPGYGLSNVFGRRFTAAGKPRGAEFQANTFSIGQQRRSAVASDGAKRFVLVWESDNQDGSERGIFGQRFFADVIFGDGFE
jgi:hypothetical protein